MSLRKEYGDYQTPRELVKRILRRLGPVGEKWDRVLEPTCGRGNFIQELVSGASTPREVKGIEIQPDYVRELRRLRESSDVPIEVILGDIFDIDLKKDLRWESGGRLLVVGNPPWVTNSELSILGSDNLPEKHNIKGMVGLDAITGGANFDIAEAIWIKIIRELSKIQGGTIALLCKTSVARNVVEYAKDRDLQISRGEIFRINSMKYFNASVDSCLFKLEVGKKRDYGVKVYSGIECKKPSKKLGVIDGRLISNIERYKIFKQREGEETYTWRQGIKHDASKVMELDYTPKTGELVNKGGEYVDVEREFLFPLMKSSDIHHGRNDTIRKMVIVTQKNIGEDTDYIKYRAPDLWGYLENNGDALDSRKSRVYDGKPRFSIFGVGNYSFARYKVAISGFYKDPTFTLLAPLEGKPVMVDDTCYFIPCSNLEEAGILSGILNHPLSVEFLDSIIFKDSKRPITKKALQQISIQRIADKLDKNEVINRAMGEICGMGETTEDDVWDELKNMIRGWGGVQSKLV